MQLRSGMSGWVCLVLLPCVCTIPWFRSSFRPVADVAQTVSTAELNRRTGSSFLYAMHGRRAVQQILEVGVNTYDVDLHWGFRQTSRLMRGTTHLARIYNRWSPPMIRGSCSSRVRVSGGYSLLLSLDCMIDSSSSESSSSSEEKAVLVRVKAPMAAQVPGIALCRGVSLCNRLLW